MNPEGQARQKIDKLLKAAGWCIQDTRVYFEQMKGRGTRTISPTDLKAVTPGVEHKTHFMIVDAVEACTSNKSDSVSLERKRGVAFDKRLKGVAMGVRDDDSLFSRADYLEKTITTSLARAGQLRQAILKKAFEGRLVPQDPGDEPASVLLERIKAEKAKQKKPPEGKKRRNDEIQNLHR